MNKHPISINNRSNRNLSMAEKRNYCLAWERSEMQQDAFCKVHGISKSALYQWRKECKKEKRGKHEIGFSPLVLNPTLSPAPTKPVDLIQLNICFQNQIQLTIAMPEHRLALFIQEVSNAATVIR